MADENFERQMEFMLQQQAESAARIKQIEEIILSLAQGTRDRFEVADKRVDDIFSRLAQGARDRFQATDKRLDGVDEKCEATDKRVSDVDVKITALVDSQIRTEETVKETSEALRNLIAVVDRYFEGRNGNPQS